VFIASASQDAKGRIWRLKLVDAAACVSDSTGLDSLDAEELERPRTFTVFDQVFMVSAEAILAGHEDWLSSVSLLVL
jgi:hypothetical protein